MRANKAHRGGGGNCGHGFATEPNTTETKRSRRIGVLIGKNFHTLKSTLKEAARGGALIGAARKIQNINRSVSWGKQQVD